MRGQHACALALPHRRELRAVEDVAERCPRALLARQLDERLAPHGFPEGQCALVTEQAPVQARRNDHEGLLPEAAREGAHVLCLAAAHAQAPVVAVAKQLRVRAPQLQGLPGEQQLGSPVLQALRERARRGAGVGVLQLG